MAYKGKSTWGTPEVHTVVPSSGMGFNSSIGKLGPDTAPGPGPGAPLNSRSVPNGPTKSVLYPSGIAPYSLNADTILPGSAKNSPATHPYDSPVSTKGRQMPDAHGSQKTDAVERAQVGIGDIPQGVLSR